ncbi:hypothetical protein niasHS_003130 [Heterodera schachtii]|uniref:Serpentine receptor class gamma n=1 Tax=Heterodera schachtii TaxID=97005 RepID=A0ABD2K9S4_HETSC
MIESILQYTNELIYFSLCISIPSLVIYCLQIVAICRNRQFHNSFFALFVLRAVPDIIGIFATSYGYRLPTVFGAVLYPIYEKLPNLARLQFYFIGAYAFEAQNIATVFMMLNRMTAIKMPFLNRKLWKRLLPLAVLCSLLFPLLLTYNDLFMSTYLLKQPNSTAFAIMEEIKEGNVSVLAPVLFIQTIDWVVHFLLRPSDFGTFVLQLPMDDRYWHSWSLELPNALGQ